jgi:hypothetical protein
MITEVNSMETTTLQEVVTKLLAAYGGNQSMLAREAGVSQNTIWKLANPCKLKTPAGLGFDTAEGLARASNGEISSIELLKIAKNERIKRKAAEKQ